MMLMEESGIVVVANEMKLSGSQRLVSQSNSVGYSLMVMLCHIKSSYITPKIHHDNAILFHSSLKNSFELIDMFF